MKIIHLVSSLNVGGSERFVIDLSRAQIKSGKSVVIYSLGSNDDELISRGECNGLSISLLSKRNPLSLLWFVFSLIRCDIIHLHSPHALSAVYTILRIFAKRKIAYTRHGAGLFDSNSWKTLHHKAAKLFKALAFVSEEAKAVFERVNPNVKLRGKVIDNGVNIPENRRTKKTYQGGVISIGSVGRMVELKYQQHLIRAIARLDKGTLEKVHVNFFGDGEDRQKLEKLALELDLGNIITFHGVVTDRSHIYQSIDVLCVTSETEGLSLAIIEAMSFNIPTIATNVGGNPTLVKPGENGWLYEFGQVDALSDILQNIVISTDSIDEFGSQASAFIADNYSIDNSEKQYQHLYAD